MHSVWKTAGYQRKYQRGSDSNKQLHVWMHKHKHHHNNACCCCCCCSLHPGLTAASLMLHNTLQFLGSPKKKNVNRERGKKSNNHHFKKGLIIKSQSLVSLSLPRVPDDVCGTQNMLAAFHSTQLCGLQVHSSAGALPLLQPFALQMSTCRLSAPWQFSCCPLSGMPNGKGALAKHWRFVFVFFAPLWATPGKILFSAAQNHGRRCLQ